MNEEVLNANEKDSLKKVIAHRWTFKIPGDVTKEEMQRLIRHETGNENYELSEEEFQQLQQQIQHKKAVREIIEPHYSTLIARNNKESRAKSSELIDLGRFIYYLSEKHKIEIIECKESPDFVINFDGQTIGVEHTRLISEDLIGESKNIKKALDRSRQIMLQRQSKISGLFNILILPHTIKINGKSLNELFRTEPDTLPGIIADFIEAYVKDDKTVPPTFIKRISFTNNIALELELSEEYFSRDLSSKKIQELIDAKEKKIYSYKTDLSSCWLLIIMEGINASSSFEIVKENLPTGNTAFDAIFIFDTFKSILIGTDLFTGNSADQMP